MSPVAQEHYLKSCYGISNEFTKEMDRSVIPETREECIRANRNQRSQVRTTERTDCASGELTVSTTKKEKRSADPLRLGVLPFFPRRYARRRARFGCFAYTGSSPGSFL